jgi:hypothetical protein
MPSFPVFAEVKAFLFLALPPFSRSSLPSNIIAADENSRTRIKTKTRTNSTSVLVFPIKTVRVNIFARTQLKDQSLKKNIATLALASLLIVSKSSAVSLDEIQFWTGAGTNRAALVVEWSSPESFTNSTVPAPVANKSLVWGYQFNGSATGTEMLKAVLDADPRLYVVATTAFGTYVEAIGYSLDGGKAFGLTDGTHTNYFGTNFLTTATVNVDAAHALNPRDLFWSGLFGPNWETWNESGDAGGFLNSPSRGLNLFWIPDDINAPYSGTHGQWDYAQLGLDSLTLTNGSWIGFSVAAGEYEDDVTAPYNSHKHAPSAPDTSITALVKNLTGRIQCSQWQAHFLSCNDWVYSLERSTNLQSWSTVTNGLAGNGTNLIAVDIAPPADKSFYRVRADRP